MLRLELERGGLGWSTQNSGHQQRCQRQDNRWGCDEDRMLTNSSGSSSEGNNSEGELIGHKGGV